MGEIKKTDGKSIAVTGDKGQIINNVSLQGKNQSDIPAPSVVSSGPFVAEPSDVDYSGIEKQYAKAIEVDSTETNEAKPRYSCGHNPHFGCGAYNCVTCYPFTYSCPDGHDYLTPVPNGEPMPDCPQSFPNGECECTAEYMAQIG